MCIFCIEGNPFITRFKTVIIVIIIVIPNRIEGNPFITRFKTAISDVKEKIESLCIEGNPFITRFKTSWRIKTYQWSWSKY